MSMKTSSAPAAAGPGSASQSLGDRPDEYWASLGPVSLDGSSDRSAGSRSNTEDIVWDEIPLGYRIQPHRRYAHCVDDIYLLGCFLELSRLTDIDGESAQLLLRAIKLQRLCDYSSEDICSILAHASVYFIDAYALCGKDMSTSEVGNVLATLMFVAHCYVQDETCPLHVWHQHLFRKYCPLRTLNAAIIRLLEIRQYRLRIDGEDLRLRYSALVEAIRKWRVDPPGGPEEAQTAPPSARSALLSKVLDYWQYR